MRPDDHTEQFPRTTPGRVTNVPNNSHRSPRRWPQVLGMLVMLFVALAACGACGAAFMAAGPSTQYDAPKPVTAVSGGATVAPSTGPTPTPPVTVEVTTFSAGQYEVGSGPGEIEPGKYRTDGEGGFFCSANRLKADGEPIGFPKIVDGPTFLTVKSSDGIIDFGGGCDWTKVES